MYQYKAKIIKVYDGDTITAEVDLGFFTKHTAKIRLAGINAPEMRGEEKKQGKISRDFLRNLILNKDVHIQTSKTGKYGRWIGEISLIEDGTSVNELMITEGYAKKTNYGQKR